MSSSVLLSQHPAPNPTHTTRRLYIFFSHSKNTAKMSGSNLVAMKKVVQQLRFEASINRVKVIHVLIVLSNM